MALTCGNRCFNALDKNYYEEDMTIAEKRCMSQCFHKTYTFLVHANSVFSYMTADQETLDKVMAEQQEDEEDELTQGVGTDKVLKTPEGQEYVVPSRKEMDLMFKKEQNKIQ